MTTEQLDEIIDEIIEERSDRSLIILSSAIIDEQLFRVLNAYLKAPLNANDDDLLRGDNPLSTFSAKIRILYRLGLIDNKLREVIDQVRKVRNNCAHNIELNINKDPIRGHINTIKRNIISRPTFELVKKRYFNDVLEPKHEIKAFLITIIVILEAIIKSIVRIEDNAKTMTISIK